LSVHDGPGESVVFIEPEANADHHVYCGLWNEKKQLGVQISFDKRELPWLTNWQHFAKNEYVTGIEPGTNPPIGQKAARESNALAFLAPGEKKSIEVNLSVLGPEVGPYTTYTNFINLINE
jgi:hypothetical protein